MIMSLFYDVVNYTRCIVIILLYWLGLISLMLEVLSDWEILGLIGVC